MHSKKVLRLLTLIDRGAQCELSHAPCTISEGSASVDPLTVGMQNMSVKKT